MTDCEQSLHCAVYVDGSFIAGKIGYGAAILLDGVLSHEISGSVADPSLVAHRQVGGELYAVLESLRWLKENNIESAEIYYDYAGVEAWPTGKWKANKDLTKQYARDVRASGISLRWQKVKSHTGDRWNEYVDGLAKKGALQTGTRPTAVKAVKAEKPALSPEKGRELVADTAEKFAEYLCSGSLQASSVGLMNDQYARVEIYDGTERLGIVDIYNTKQSGLKPDLRAFSDMDVKHAVARQWISFLETVSRGI